MIVRPVAGLGDDGVFYLVSGHYRFADTAARDAFLENLGASLVFLIDWNKARKVLRQWLSKTDATDVLAWAAQNRVGHRAFVELGGSDLVSAAVGSPRRTDTNWIWGAFGSRTWTRRRT